MRNLEAVEVGLREAVFRDLCAILEELLNDPALPVPQDYSQPGEKCHVARAKEFLSLFGYVPLRRNYYHRAAKEEGRVPLDEALGLWAGYSPGVLRVLCRLAARFPFEIAATEFKAYCGLEVQGRQIEFAVLGNDYVRVINCCEILNHGDFYDYENSGRFYFVRA